MNAEDDDKLTLGIPYFQTATVEEEALQWCVYLYIYIQYIHT